MSRDLVLDVIAKKNSRDLSTLADEFDRLASKTDDAGKKMHETGTFSQFLDDQITKTKVHVKELGDEFDRTGSKDVFAKLRGAQGSLASLERIKKDLTKALGDGGAEGGQEAAPRFLEQFKGVLGGGGGFSSFMPGLIGAGIAAAVAVAPGAILGATGLSGIALGVVGQLRDPGVVNAAKDAGHSIMAALSADTAPFAKPLETALADLAGAAKTALDSIDFSQLAADVVPIASAFGGLVDNIMPGFNEALKAAQPVLQEFEHDLPALGDAISQMFSLFADGSGGAAQSMRLLMVLLGGTALAIGIVVDLAAHLYSWFLHAFDVGTEWAKTLIHAIKPLDQILGPIIDKIHDIANYLRFGDKADGVTKVGRSFHDMGGAVKLTADDLDKLNQKLDATTDATSAFAAKAVDKLFSEMMNADQASLHWHESLNQLADTLAKNHLAIDKHTNLISMNSKAGLENRAAILAAVQANEQQYQAMVAGGISATDAAQAYDQNTRALEKQLRAAHFTGDQINDLIGKYRNVPDQVNTALAVQGLTEALNNLGNLIAEVNHLNGRDFGFTVTETHVYTADYRSYRAGERTGGATGGAFVTGYAGGGRVFEVGEQGREYLTLPAMSAPAYVTPNSTINGGANRGGDGTDLGTLTVVIKSDSGEEIARKLVNLGRRTGRKTFDALIPVSTAR